MVGFRLPLFGAEEDTTAVASNPTTQQPTSKNQPAPATKAGPPPTAVKSEPPPAKMETSTQIATNGQAGAAVTAPETKPDAKPTQAQVVDALRAILASDKEMEALTEKRNKAIQTMLDAGHDEQPVDIKGKLFTFRKRNKNIDEGTVTNYFMEPYANKAPAKYDID